jgi:hypothetical protein
MKRSDVEPKFTHKECTVPITFSPATQRVLDLVAELRKIEQRNTKRLAQVIATERKRESK